MTKVNACKICQNYVLSEGMCLGLAKNNTYKELVPTNIHSPLLEDWVIENSVREAIIKDGNCDCTSFKERGWKITNN